MAFHLAFLQAGFVMEKPNVLMEVMKNLRNVVCRFYPIMLDTTVEQINLGNWSCEGRQFQCPHLDPKCISLAQVCNDHWDCKDGTDESSHVCGEILETCLYMVNRITYFVLLRLL